jgi:peptidoglycan/xylan/chitin deacetylase (PgdA/CDA1 family)
MPGIEHDGELTLLSIDGKLLGGAASPLARSHWAAKPPETMTLQKNGWGPSAQRAAVSFTFDNLGEAADIEFGKWPASEPLGSHYTVTEVLPELMSKLNAGKVTFFVEGWNAENYPGTLRELATRGHDVALHGWRHEIWSKLHPSLQKTFLQRSLNAFANIGLRPRGFRPPGGSVPENPSPWLRKLGFLYYSAIGEFVSVEAGVAQIPFAWRHLDGTYLMPHVGAKVIGDTALPRAPASLEGMRQAFLDAMHGAVDQGVHLTLVFHPWLLGQDRDRMQLLFELYEHATQSSELWVAPCQDVAEWLLRDSPGRPS